jgi:translation initiation factor 4E
MIETSDSEHFFNDTWCFYFHDPHNEDWSKGSFKLLTHMSSMETYWGLYNKLEAKLQFGMFFLFRESIFPLWEESDNNQGGCFSIKVTRDRVPHLWKEIAGKMICERLLKNEFADKWTLVNGISISPKKHFCVLKIWMRTRELTEPRACLDLICPELNDCTFRSHE